jgi:hypothetical protein
MSGEMKMTQHEEARVVKIQIDKDSHPRAYHPYIGDVVQFYIDYPIISSTTPGYIDVSVENDTLITIGIANTSDLKKPGGGQLSSFIYVSGEGLCHVTLRPSVENNTGNEYRIAILPEKKEQ